jgi:Sulfotransferase family
VNPYLFLVGCPRSGTTLLYRLLDAHPDLALVHETLWIPQLWERRTGISDDGAVTPELVPALLAERRFERLGISAAELRDIVAGNGRVTYPAFVTAVFDQYAAAQGKPLAGDKTPGYVRSMPTLHSLWPHARFVHLIRDGRDVCLSALGWKKAGKVFRDFATWKDEPVTTAALWWERCVRLGQEAGRRLPTPLYHEVRYEELVSEPEDVCRELCRFLGLAFEGSMLRFHEGKTRDGPELTSKRRWLPPTEGMRDWRRELPGEGLREFEAAAGDLLEGLGYERGASRLDPDLVARARELRHRFAAEVTARGRPLPEAWA